MITFAQVYRLVKKEGISLNDATSLMSRESRRIVEEQGVESQEYQDFRIERDLWVDYVHSTDQRNPCFNCGK